MLSRQRGTVRRFRLEDHRWRRRGAASEAGMRWSVRYRGARSCCARNSLILHRPVTYQLSLVRCYCCFGSLLVDSVHWSLFVVVDIQLFSAAGCSVYWVSASDVVSSWWDVIHMSSLMSYDMKLLIIIIPMPVFIKLSSLQGHCVM